MYSNVHYLLVGRFYLEIRYCLLHVADEYIDILYFHTMYYFVI